MRGFLLDTNILSELRRPRPEPAVTRFLEAQPEERLFISAITLAEIRFGIAQATDPERRVAIEAWLAHTLRPLFAGRTLAISEEIILRWRILIESGRKQGHTFGQLDLFIAATAAQEGLVLVSRDAVHFLAAGVPHLDPWSGRYTPSAGDGRIIGSLSSAGLLEQL